METETAAKIPNQIRIYEPNEVVFFSLEYGIYEGPIRTVNVKNFRNKTVVTYQIFSVDLGHINVPPEKVFPDIISAADHRIKYLKEQLVEAEKIKAKYNPNPVTP